MRLTLLEILSQTGGELIGDGNVVITGLAKIEEAGSGHLTFLANRKYLKYLGETGASAVIVPQDVETPEGKSYIRAKNSYFAFLKAVRMFHPDRPVLEEGIHSTAVIGKDCRVRESVRIGGHVVIGDRCTIGNNTTLMPGVVLGDEVTVGDDCVIHSNVSIREKVVLGNRIIIHDGTVVGSDGFGYAFEGGKYHKIPQIGTVVIEDDVEIGANVTVDRASLGETRIRKGAKLDNLIQIAHNCIIGENTAIAAQAGLSGSTIVGKGVRIGGQAGFAGHMKIGDFAAVTAQSGVSKDVPPGVIVSGYMAMPHREALRHEAALRKLPELLNRIKILEQKIEAIDKETKREC
jgi:UDP-3-O-[3-hydroxymyristoyl] glucosamine N-acyltransferase